MASITQDWKLTGMANVLETVDQYQEIYDRNCHRVYSLAFWMTDNEMAAEELTSSVFHRAFAMSASPSAEAIDRALINELRTLAPIGSLTLDRGACNQVLNVRSNTLRVHLERAVVQLPATERLIFLFHDVENYGHATISRLLGITQAESRFGLHQARLRMRELVASMR